MLPLTKTPLLEAPPIPPKKVNGIDITKAQGQETTKKDKALYSQSEKLASLIKRGGITAKRTAIITTIGV